VRETTVERKPLRLALIGTRGVPARYGGFETCAEEVSTRLVARGHDVTVYCRPGNVPGNPSEYKGVHLEYAPAINRKSLSTLSHSLGSLASAVRRHFDALLVFNAGNAPMVALARAAAQRVVVNVDGQEWKRGKWGPVARVYYQAAERVCALASNRVVVDSRTIGDYYQLRWSAPSTYIPYGAPVTKSEDRSILERYGLEPNGYVLMASRLEPENNAALLIEAWQAVPNGRQLAIVGAANWDSAYVRDLKRAAAATRGVRMLGGVYERGHYDELLCNCFVYVHGNEVGGTSPGLLRALGAGACVLSIDADINREVGGESVLYFKKDPDDLAGLLKRVLDDPDLVAGKRSLARSTVASRYDWEAVAGGYEELLYQVREGRTSRRTPRS
jgi:glycosyltransferase involved in cell wall biosynthesis